MKILVVYYSSDGNTRFIAKAIAGYINAELMELKPKEDIPRSGFWRYFYGGKQVVNKEKVELQTTAYTAQDYDLIFIGTPVWAFSFSPAVRSFISTAGLKEKKIALFCCHGGMPGGTLPAMAGALPGNLILGQADFLEPAQRNSEAFAQKAREWAKGIVESCHG